LSALLFSARCGSRRSSELAAADEYELDDYRRIAVPLRSGASAWVSVFAG
jgi:hypothetical protein